MIKENQVGLGDYDCHAPGLTAPSGSSVVAAHREGSYAQVRRRNEPFLSAHAMVCSCELDYYSLPNNPKALCSCKFLVATLPRPHWPPSGSSDSYDKLGPLPLFPRPRMLFSQPQVTTLPHPGFCSVLNFSTRVPQILYRTLQPLPGFMSLLFILVLLNYFMLGFYPPPLFFLR